jgi:MFS family permease
MAGAYAMGHLSDHRGPRQALFWGLGLTMVSILSISLFDPGPWHALSYFGAGFGGSNFVAFMVVILKHAGRDARTVMTGFINSILAPFIFAVPLLLNVLALATGYRWAFLVSGCACLAGFWLVAKVKSLDD